MMGNRRSREARVGLMLFQEQGHARYITKRRGGDPVEGRDLSCEYVSTAGRPITVLSLLL